MTLYEYLNISDYEISLEGNNDPGRIVVDEFITAANRIPKDINNYDVSNDDLATICLNACYRAEHYLTKAELFRDFKKTNLDYIFGHLMAHSSLPVTIRKEALKEEAEYISALNKLNIAEAYVAYFSRLKSVFEKTHYMARGREMRETKDIKISNYEPHDGFSESYPDTNRDVVETDSVSHSIPKVTNTKSQGVEDFEL